MTVPARNLRTLVIGASAAMVLILAISVLSVDRSNDPMRRPSSFFTDDSGARAVYLVMDELFEDVTQWRRPLSELPSAGPAAGTTLVVLGPSQGISSDEATALDGWISSGGQLILASSAGWALSGEVEGEDSGGGSVDDAGTDDEEPVNFLARHGIETPRPEPDDEDPAFGEIPLSEAVYQMVGTGRIVYIPDSYAFSNRSLADPERAVWLSQRLGEWGSGALLDEYHHGFGQPRRFRGLIGTFLVSPWGLVCLQLFLAGVVYLLGTRRRFGRPIEPLTPERTSPMESVEALGGLLSAANATRLAARAIHVYLNTRLSSTLGRTVDLSDPESRRSSAERLGMNVSQLEAYGKRAEALIAGTVSASAELMVLGREAAAITGSLSHGIQRKRKPRSAR